MPDSFMHRRVEVYYLNPNRCFLCHDDFVDGQVVYKKRHKGFEKTYCLSCAFVIAYATSETLDSLSPRRICPAGDENFEAVDEIVRYALFAKKYTASVQNDEALQQRVGKLFKKGKYNQRTHDNARG